MFIKFVFVWDPMKNEKEGSKATPPGYEQTVAENARLKMDLAERDKTIARLKADLAERDDRIANLEASVVTIKNALSKVLSIMSPLGAVGGVLADGCSDLKSYVESIEKHLDEMVAAQSGRSIRGDGRHRVWMRMDLLDEYIQNDRLLHALTLLKPKVFEYVVYKTQKYIEAHPSKLYYNMESRKTEPGKPLKAQDTPHGVCDLFCKENEHGARSRGCPVRHGQNHRKAPNGLYGFGSR